MSIAATDQKVRRILTSRYSTQSYLELMQEIFYGMKIVAPNQQRKEFSNFSSHIENYTHIGNYVSPKKENVAILAVCLKGERYVENSRSTQRSYAKKLIQNAGSDAAMIAFYTEGESRWRISFVRLDYEMRFENGKLKAQENLTPARRYSYLVGEGEPCHTAVDRFRRFINEGIPSELPTLADLEDAFSVEKVTNEFFALYCEKFHQLCDTLRTNEDFMLEAEQHNYTVAQFAKKLMGQIVFLYFLQKKGWLGVNAWPNRLTEAEFKRAYYARGAKSRELIPQVYKLTDDGSYRISTSALNALDDSDEETLAYCVKGQPWGTGPKDFMRRLFQLAEAKNENFFENYLEPLFYDALNQNRGENGYCPKLHCRIPFLSGGLFEPIDGYAWKENNFAIPNEVFSNAREKGLQADGILDIFDRYNFTMSEDEPMEREVAIDPEMLGKVFENLLEIQDRKSKGAFYTPREIVHYMCQESLIAYLVRETGVSETAIRDFILYGDFMKDEDTVKAKREGNGGMYISEELFLIDDRGEIVTDRLKDVDKALATIRVADPAVGSGAFPLGMLNEIVRARQNITAYMAIPMNSYDRRYMYQTLRSPYALKYETIKNCIFAADIEPSAVDIAQLRLWLSLVIDDEINPSAQNELEGHRNPSPLPNLECNIVCGNSLLDEFEGYQLINQSDIIGTTAQNQQVNMLTNVFEQLLPELIRAQDDLFRCKSTDEKMQLKERINDLRDALIRVQLQGASSDTLERYAESVHGASKPFVLWQLDFARVFREKAGFDIVIGNPPYVDSEEMTRSMPEQREIYTRKYRTAKGNWDLFIPFIEKGTSMLTTGGVITYIVPNKLISAPYAVAARKMIAENQVNEIRDYSSVNVFKSAAVYPVVFRVTKAGIRTPVAMNVMRDMIQVETRNIVEVDTFYADVNWDKYFTSEAGALDIISKMSIHPELQKIASVNGAATVSEAYLVKEFMLDMPEADVEYKRFINTGGLDPYKSFYGKEFIRYLKGKYLYPVVPVSELENLSHKRLLESNAPKIIIGGMTKILECYYDHGEYLAGKSTTIVYGNAHLRYLTAVLNSRLMTFYYQVFFNSMSLAGGFYRIGAPQIKTLPIAMPADSSIIDKIEDMVEKVQEILVDNGSDSPQVQDILKEIDSVIYSIYGLTSQEISIVEAHLNE